MPSAKQLKAKQKYREKVEEYEKSKADREYKITRAQNRKADRESRLANRTANRKLMAKKDWKDRNPNILKYVAENYIKHFNYDSSKNYKPCYNTLPHINPNGYNFLSQRNFTGATGLVRHLFNNVEHKLEELKDLYTPELLEQMAKEMPNNINIGDFKTEQEAIAYMEKVEKSLVVNKFSNKPQIWKPFSFSINIEPTKENMPIIEEIGREIKKTLEAYGYEMPIAFIHTNEYHPDIKLIKDKDGNIVDRKIIEEKHHSQPHLQGIIQATRKIDGKLHAGLGKHRIYGTNERVLRRAIRDKIAKICKAHNLPEPPNKYRTNTTKSQGLTHRGYVELASQDIVEQISQANTGGKVSFNLAKPEEEQDIIDGTITELNKRITELNNNVKKLDKLLTDKNKTIEENNKTITKLNEDITKYKTALNNLKQKESQAKPSQAQENLLGWTIDWSQVYNSTKKETIQIDNINLFNVWTNQEIGKRPDGSTILGNKIGLNKEHPLAEEYKEYLLVAKAYKEKTGNKPKQLLERQNRERVETNSKEPKKAQKTANTGNHIR